MPKDVYNYWAKDSLNKNVTGSITAVNHKDAISILREQGYKPWRLEKDTTESAKEEKLVARIIEAINSPIGSSGNLKLAVISNIFRQLGNLLAAGLPIDRSLKVLQRVTRNSTEKGFIQEGYNAVFSGNTLSSVWRANYLGLPPYAASMILAGESSGRLEESLKQAADVMDTNEQMRTLVVSSLAYPVLLLGASLTVVMVLIIFAVPQFEIIFTMWGSELPFTTRVLIELSAIIKNHGLMIGLGFSGLLLLMTVWFVSKKGRKMWAAFILTVPVIGLAVRDVACSRLFRTLSVMLQSGVQFADGMRIAAGVSGNIHITQAMKNAAQRVENGASLSQVLKEKTFFPETVVELIAIGEETGDLTSVMGQVAHLLENETRQKLKYISALLEPVMILFMALVVGFVVVGILLPVVTMMDVPVY